MRHGRVAGSEVFGDRMTTVVRNGGLGARFKRQPHHETLPCGKRKEIGLLRRLYLDAGDGAPDFAVNALQLRCW